MSILQKPTATTSVRTTGPWRTEYRCANCAAAVTRFAIMTSDGRCPHCGFKGANAGTLLEYTEHPYRMEARPWWKFWARRRRIYARNTDLNHNKS